MQPAEKINSLANELVTKVFFEPDEFRLKRFGKEKVLELKSLLKGQSKNDYIYAMLGTAYSYLRKKDEVIRNFEIAKKLNPFNVVTLRNYWVELHYLDEDDLAIEEISTTLDSLLIDHGTIPIKDVSGLFIHGLELLAVMLGKKGKEKELPSYMESLKTLEACSAIFSEEFEGKLKALVLIGKNRLDKMHGFLTSNTHYAYPDSIEEIKFTAPELPGAEDVVFFTAVLKKGADVATNVDRMLEYEDFIYKQLEENFPSSLLDKMVFRSRVENGC